MLVGGVYVGMVLRLGRWLWQLAPALMLGTPPHSCSASTRLAPCPPHASPTTHWLQGLEKYVMSKVWRQTFGTWQEDRERDERYQRLMQAGRRAGVRPSSVGWAGVAELG